MSLPLLARSETVITGFRTADNKDYSRFVLDTDSPAKYKTFTLENPFRVIIDIDDAVWKAGEEPPLAAKSIKEVRFDKKEDGTLRVVLDFSRDVSVKKIFNLGKTATAPERIVVDLIPTNEKQAELPMPTNREGESLTAPLPKLKSPLPLIVIDAGHGGHDPGTIGSRAQEKNITLLYSLELAKQLKDTNRYRVHLTRDDDNFIPLRERVSIAKRVHGDMFISLHVNSHPNRDVDGFSVYTLSERSSDKESAALAAKENKAGIIGDIDLNDEDDIVSTLLIDMAQRDTKNMSASFAEELVDNMKSEVKLLRSPHRFAGFRVLTGPDVPSVLIELGYITNKKEEKLLLSENYKKNLAELIVKSIDNHFTKYQTE